jgi:hypothetical protein
LNKPGGQALLARLHKAAKTAEKEKPTIMDTQTELIGIMKNGGGAVSLCKAIVDRGRSPCDEHGLVAALTKYASEQHPSLRPDTAFCKLYEAEESVRRACGLAKSAGPMFDMTIVSPGDETRRTVNDTEQSEAYQTLQALADKLHAAATGRITKEQAFAAAFTDPANRELAQKAHRRPSATTNFPFPR